ncbi:MAG: hypothetical protein U0800_27270 [Isosphaeraceae bacterium]
MVFGAIGFYLFLMCWLIIPAAAVGGIAALMDRLSGKENSGSWWAAVNRPIRLFPRRQARQEASFQAWAQEHPIPAGPPRRFRWHWTVWLTIVAAPFFAASFAAGLYSGWKIDRRLANAIAQAHADDPHWRFEDIIDRREFVPFEEDSALIVSEVLGMLPGSWPAGPPPQPGEPRPAPSAALSVYERLDGLRPNIRLDDDTADVLRAEMVEHSEAVALARSLADYERGSHELDFTPDLLSTSLEESQQSRIVARLLFADAAMRSHGGDPDGALESCRAILGTGRSIGDETFLISNLVRYAIGGVARKAALRALAQGEPSDASLAALQADLLAEIDEPLLARGFRWERGMHDEIYRRIRDGELPIDALSSESGRRRTWKPNAIAPWGKLMFDSYRAAGLEWMNEAVAIADRPARERPSLWKAWEAEIVRVRDSRFEKYGAVLPLLLTPAVDQAEVADTRSRCELATLVALLAAERHRRKTGEWPESIDAIGAEFLPRKPDDPYTGGPFRVSHRDGRYVVYSVGPNLADDGGEYDAKTWRKGGPDDNVAEAWDVALRGQPPGEHTMSPEDVGGERTDPEQPE